MNETGHFHAIVCKELPVSPRVAAGLNLVQQGRYIKKKSWGQGMSILEANTVYLPLVKRKALAIKTALSKMPIAIEQHELLVGCAILSMASQKATLPEYATLQEKKEAAAKLTGPGSVWGHSSPNYAKFLRQGIRGLEDEARSRLAKIRKTDSRPDSAAWYESVLIAMAGLRTLICRYKNLTRKLADNETGQDRKRELLNIAHNLNHLIDHPPNSFYQALQAVLIAHIAFMSTMNLLPLGRLDQYLWPFLQSDLQKGILTLDQAQELVDLFWVKCNELLQAYAIQENPGGPEDALSLVNRVTRAGAFSLFMGGKTTQDRMYSDGGTSQQFLQTVTLGGLTPLGEDGTNPLTYICINATYRLMLPQPCIYVRFHESSPVELLERVADCIRTGCIGPTIYNDKVLVPALNRIGIPIEHARDYTSDGCWEPHIQGRTYFKHGFVSAAEALDRVLSPHNWEQVEVPLYIEEMDPFKGSVEADPYSFESFEQIMDAFKDKLDCYIKGYIKARETFEDGRLFDIAPLPLFSAF
ncbi:MAG: pyruvate formate lyase family protein, partial [Deltaproteobacteria bacterium]|nr:pyruvate formate lyase family protein [Deltaproteobacteria bacterium]